ncbi:MAG: hypothetical protein KatS3mg014_2595 [Actinomycetota bacterium]|nr:MAG: hypothetical protein KatS3mg014_2595 [Actinomycetota bacterium]
MRRASVIGEALGVRRALAFALLIVVLGPVACGRVASGAGEPSPRSADAGDAEPVPWWEHPEDFPDHDYEQAAAMAIGPCPEGRVVEVREWEEGAAIMQAWENVAPPEAVDAAELDPLAATPRAVDIWFVEVNDPEMLIASAVDPDPSEIPPYSSVRALCSEVEPGRLALVSRDIFIASKDGALLQAVIGSGSLEEDA